MSPFPTIAIAPSTTAPNLSLLELGAAGEPEAPLARPAQYAASVLFVAVAVGAASMLERSVGAPNVTLVFVLPVIVAAIMFGWGPSLAATAASVLSFDYFFTEPRYSLAIASPSDVWAAILLAVIAAGVSALAAQSRRREQEANRASAQADALRALAMLVTHAESGADFLAASAATLTRIFAAPSVIFIVRNGVLTLAASAGGARVGSAEEDAALVSSDSRLPTRAGVYPCDKSSFDFWPVMIGASHRFVIGVSFVAEDTTRPRAPERFIDVVGALLAVATGG